MQRLEVSGAVRPLYRSLGVKGLRNFSRRTLQPAVAELSTTQTNSVKFVAENIKQVTRRKRITFT